MPTKPWIEFPLVLIMVVGPAVILYQRLKERKAGHDSPRGIGVRVIQLVALLLVIPAVSVLTLEGKLSSEGVGTLLGVIVGYTLSGVVEAVPSKEDSKSSQVVEEKKSK